MLYVLVYSYHKELAMEPRYLNNGGTRWVTADKIRVVGFHNGKRYYKMRKPMYWEAMGNFVRCYIKVGDNVFRGTTYDNNGVIEFDIMKSFRLR